MGTAISLQFYVIVILLLIYFILFVLFIIEVTLILKWNSAYYPRGFKIFQKEIPVSDTGEALARLDGATVQTRPLFRMKNIKFRKLTDSITGFRAVGFWQGYSGWCGTVRPDELGCSLIVEVRLPHSFLLILADYLIIAVMDKTGYGVLFIPFLALTVFGVLSVAYVLRGQAELCRKIAAVAGVGPASA